MHAGGLTERCERNELSGEDMTILRKGKLMGTLREDGSMQSNAPELQQLNSVWQKQGIFTMAPSHESTEEVTVDGAAFVAAIRTIEFVIAELADRGYRSCWTSMSDTAFCCTRSARAVLSKHSRVGLTSLSPPLAPRQPRTFYLVPISNGSIPVTSETILEVGAEGGSLTLRRERIANGNWRFCAALNEMTIYESLSDEDRGSPGDYLPQSGYVESLQEALKILDKYPWITLLPLNVHPEFFDTIMAEVRKRGGELEETRWREKLGIQGGLCGEFVRTSPTNLFEPGSVLLAERPG